MKTIQNLDIASMVDKLLDKNKNEAPVNSKKNLNWVKDLLNKISLHYHSESIETSQGTIDSVYGYNVHMKSALSNGSLYFRVNPEGVEFQNNKKIRKECSEELVEEVIEYCNRHFLRNSK
jgi:hypothetical protein